MNNYIMSVSKSELDEKTTLHVMGLSYSTFYHEATIISRIYKKRGYCTDYACTPFHEKEKYDEFIKDIKQDIVKDKEDEEEIKVIMNHANSHIIFLENSMGLTYIGDNNDLKNILQVLFEAEAE